MAKAPKMVSLSIEETSGVDHPAHLHEGWLVVKAADPSEVDRIVASLKQTTEEDTVPEEPTAVTDDAPVAEPQAEQVVEVVVPDTIEALTAELAAARAEIDALKTITDEEPADDLALVKSAPEPVQKAFEALREQAAAAMEKAAAVEEILRKERDARADEAAIAKAATWTNLQIDPSTVGPALRRVALQDEALAKSIEDALNAANAQAESGAIFAEIGKATGPASGSAYERLSTMAKAAVDSGASATMEQAMASLALSQPDLYSSYLTEKGA